MSAARLSPQQEAILAEIRGGGAAGVSSWDLVHRTHCLKYTNRISELRALGFDIECETVDAKHGHYRYKLVDTAPKGQAEMFTRTPWNPVSATPARAGKE